MRIAFCLDQRLCSEKAHPKYAFFMCYALAKLGNHVALYAKGNTENAYEYFGLPRINTLHIESIPRGIKGVYRYWVAFEVFFRKQYDFILVSEIKIAKLLVRFRKMRKVPLFIDVHDSRAIAKETPDREESQVFGGVNGIITTTEALRIFLDKMYNISKPTVALPLGGLPYPNYLSTFEPDKIKIWNVLYIGSVHPRKGVQLVVQAAKELCEKRAPIKIHAIGPDYGGLDSLLALVKTNRIENIFTYHGYFPPAQLQERIKAIDPHILVIPRYDEQSRYTASMKAVEYLGYGRPIVAVFQEGIAEVLKDGHNALLIGIPDPKEMAKAIEMIIANRTLARDLAYNALESSRKYTYEARALSLLSFVRDATVES